MWRGGVPPRSEWWKALTSIRRCHCEERRDEAIHLKIELDCRSRQGFFAMTCNLNRFKTVFPAVDYI